MAAGRSGTTRHALAGGIAWVVAVSACRPAPPPVDARILTDWMRAQYALVRAERLSPPVASRVFAYGAVALYEGVAAGSPRLRSLAGQLNGLTDLPRPQPRERYDWAIVAASAETTLLKVLFKEGLPATQVAIAQLGDSQIAARRTSRAVRDRSTTYGATVGRAIADWATGDRFSETRGLAWKPPRGPRYWVNTAEPQQYISVSLSAQSEAVSLQNPADTLTAGAGASSPPFGTPPELSGLKTPPAPDPTGGPGANWGALRALVAPSPAGLPPPPPPPPS